MIRVDDDGQGIAAAARDAVLCRGVAPTSRCRDPGWACRLSTIWRSSTAANSDWPIRRTQTGRFAARWLAGSADLAGREIRNVASERQPALKAPMIQAPTPSSRALSPLLAIVPAVVLMALVLVDTSAVDFAVEGWFYTAGDGFIGKHAWVLEDFMHDFLKKAVIVFALLALLCAAGAAWLDGQLQPSPVAAVAPAARLPGAGDGSFHRHCHPPQGPHRRSLPLGYQGIWWPLHLRAYSGPEAGR